MKISEVIKKLQEIKGKHGDIDVCYYRAFEGGIYSYIDERDIFYDEIDNEVLIG